MFCINCALAYRLSRMTCPYNELPKTNYFYGPLKKSLAVVCN